MITNPVYKIYALQIAKHFCNTDELCRVSVQQRIINYFNNNTFEFFLTKIQTGRFYVLKYSNWHTGNNCREMLIDVKLTDVITGVVTTGYWNYTNENCDDKQYYYPDLNALIGRFGYQLMDAPIMSKNNSDITKERLIYNPKASTYGITYVPGVPGQNNGSEIIVTPDKQFDPMQNTPVSKQAGFDLSGILDNPILLYGGIALLFFFLMKK